MYLSDDNENGLVQNELNRVKRVQLDCLKCRNPCVSTRSSVVRYFWPNCECRHIKSDFSLDQNGNNSGDRHFICIVRAYWIGAAKLITFSIGVVTSTPFALWSMHRMEAKSDRRWISYLEHLVPSILFLSLLVARNMVHLDRH